MRGGFLLGFFAVVVAGMQRSLSHEVGNMVTEFVVEQGHVKYKVPMVLPKGFPSHLFKLDLVYDSGTGQGPMGLGWTIGGLSQITRCPQTQAQDGHSRGIQYDREDRYCLDGSRLVLTSGTNGMPGSTYGSEIDTFSKVFAIETQGNGPSRFLVKTKNNQQLTFGTQDNSRLYAPGEQSIHSWKQDSISDYANNIINISYVDDATAKGLLVESIAYKTMVIKFDYEARRDISHQYWNGKLLHKLDKRLKSVKTFVNNYMHRELKITYAEVKVRKLSVVTSLQLCSRELKCHKPVKLAFRGMEDANHANAPSYWTNQFGPAKNSGGWNPRAHQRHIIDMNDDGLPDMVGFSNGGVIVALNKQGAFEAGKVWVASYGSKSGGWGGNHPRHVADVNGDHLPDIVGFGNAGVFVSLNTGSNSFTTPKLWLAEFGHNAGGWRTQNHLRFVKDVNGDGLSDIIGFGDHGVIVSIGTGSTFLKGETWIKSFVYKADGWRVESHPRFLEDVNGDGLPDIVGCGYPGVYAALNTGSSFGPPTYWIKGSFGYYQGWRTNHHPRFVLDVNGDGLSDIVGFSCCGVEVSLSTGRGFLPPERWINAFGHSHGWHVNNHPRFVNDVNGDGLPDVVGFTSHGIVLALNTGFSFATEQKWVSGYSTTAEAPRYVVDVTGDGMADIVGIENSGVLIVTNNNEQTLMTSVTDSYGKVKQVLYSSLADKAIYSRGEPCQHPDPKVNIAQTVVKQLRESNGVGGLNTTKFSYRGMRINMKGRGPLVFSEIAERRVEKEEDVITNYLQTFPLTGAIKSITKRIGGKVIFNSKKAYSSHGINKKLVHLKEDVIHHHELNGDLIRKERLSVKVDSYGNIIELEKITSANNDDRTFKQTTLNNYENNPKIWFIGRLDSTSVMYEKDSTSLSRNSVFYYNSDTRKLMWDVREPDSRLALNTSYVYNNYGQVIEKHETPLHRTLANDKPLTSRSVFTTYDSLGIRIMSTTNGLGHVETYTYDPYGNLQSLIGVNGQVTRFQHDEFDRTTFEFRSDGLSVNRSIQYSDGTALQKNGVYMENITSTGAKDTLKMYDSSDRPVRIISKGFKENLIYHDIEYDSYGNVKRQSFPYFIKHQQPVWINYEYDKTGRQLREERPSGMSASSIKRTVYNGLVTENIDANGNIKRIEKDELGNIIKVTDALNGMTKYEYNAMGNLMKTVDPEGHTVSMTYDRHGNKISMKDPDMGLWRYSYNVHGEKIWQKDSIGNERFYRYDVLGRIVEVQDSEGMRSWIYDQGQNSKGKLVRTTSSNGHAMEYTYNTKGKQTRVSQQIGGETFDVKSEYDDNGRLSSQTLPGGKTVYYCYDNQGFMTEVRRTTCDRRQANAFYWKAVNYDAFGHIAIELYGNLLLTEYTFDRGNNLNTIQTWDEFGRTKRHWEYNYDPVGNVVERKDMDWDTIEKFSYDPLDRVTRATISSSAPRKKAAFSEVWEYDSIGNIERYSGFGGLHFQYSTTRPHALLKAGTHTYDYDANGNVIRKDDETITWTSFNKPKTITTKPRNTIRFEYDADETRIKKSCAKETVVYVGKLYERTTVVTPQPRKTTHKYFIYALGRLVAIDSEVKTESRSQSSTNYLHGDILDSVDTISNDQGQIVESLRYNAYGRKRSANWAKFEDCAPSSGPPSPYTNRGFTGHEHLEDLLLIHMNGRIYDPVVGRFLSPDPNIQDPFNTQSYNRYSYTLNNPLKHKDPSGFFLRKIGRFLKKHWRPLVAIAASVVTLGVATPAFGNLVASVGLVGKTATVASGALAGATSGFVGGAIASESIKGGLQAAFGGAVAGGVGGYFGDTWNLERVTTEAIVGGVSTELSGGKFTNGLLISGITASSRYLYNSRVRYDVDWKPGGPAQVKGSSDMPIEGANNVGTQGHETIDPAGWFNEGGKLSRVFNQIPGVNAVAGMHDVFQIKLDRVWLPHARDVFNVPGMIPAGAITYAALMQGPASQALLVEERKR